MNYKTLFHHIRRAGPSGCLALAVVATLPRSGAAETACVPTNSPTSFTSAVLVGGGEPQHIRVDVRGWRELFLTVSDEGDYNHDVANWAEAKLLNSNGEAIWLDTMVPASVRQGWGNFKRDNKPAVGGTMNVGGRPFKRGLGTHAPSTLRYKLSGDFVAFEADIGIDGSRKPGEGSVRFIVSDTPQRPTVSEKEVVSELASFNCDALRLAIRDMAETYPARYTNGAGYLARVDSLDQARERLVKAGTAQERAAMLASLKALKREALLANPLLDFDRLLMLKRETTAPARTAAGRSLGIEAANWSTADSVPRRNAFKDTIATLTNLRGEPRLNPIYEAPERKTLLHPVLNFDGERLLLAMEGTGGNWRLSELRLADKSVRELTPDHGSDVGFFDGCYLPDERIICASTASYQGLPCVFGSEAMTCLYLLEPRSGKMRQLTFEQDSDWCPTVLPSGRVLYLRWEYTDQSHSNSRFLFHMNPDGTDQREFRGSGSWFPGSFFYATPIPGDSHRVIGVASGHHGTARSGRLLVLDPRVGRKDREGVQEIPGREKSVEAIVRDRLVDGVWPQFLMPAPLSTKYHLVTAKTGPEQLWGIYLVDVFDNVTLVHEMEDAALLWPMPLRQRERPPVIADRVDPATAESTVVITDVHAGPGLDGVPRGSVKKLRVIEYYFARRGMGGLYGTLGADGPWDIKRILGTVPVEEDGSAHFTMPANTPVSVQPLDDRGQALQLERSWFVGMPGERVSCVGCHETQDSAALARGTLALRRAPTSIEPWYGPARGFSFVREVQPVLDRHCSSCHSESGGALPLLTGGAALTNWSTQLSGHWPGGGKFTRAYWELQRFVRRPGIEGDRRMFTPMDYHFSTTELGQLLRKGHYGVDLESEGWERLAAWVDLNAPFYGTWKEIPAFTTGYGPLKPEQVASVNSRSIELRRTFVPMGPLPDYEEIPAAKRYDSTPLPSKKAALKRPDSPPVPGWPFDASTAVAMQRQAANGAPMRSLDLGSGVTVELARIPGGEFVMGSANGHADEMPPNAVKVQPFWMARFETSNRQFRRYNATHESRTEDRHGYQFGAVGYNQDSPEQPAVRVSWEEAIAFCAWLSERTHMEITLPTEAEWEWACRAGAATPFHFGAVDADYSSFANLGDQRLREFAADTSLDHYSSARPMKNPNSYDDWLPRDDRFNDGGFVTETVGKYKPNAWGLHDMHGNAAEWTLSAYRPFPFVDKSDAGISRDTERVVRGGSWRDRPFRATASFRLPYRQHQRVCNVGFRIVCRDAAPQRTAQLIPTGGGK